MSYENVDKENKMDKRQGLSSPTTLMSPASRIIPKKIRLSAAFANRSNLCSGSDIDKELSSLSLENTATSTNNTSLVFEGGELRYGEELEAMVRLEEKSTACTIPGDANLEATFFEQTIDHAMMTEVTASSAFEGKELYDDKEFKATSSDKTLEKFDPDLEGLWITPRGNAIPGDPNLEATFFDKTINNEDSLFSQQSHFGDSTKEIIIFAEKALNNTCFSKHKDNLSEGDKFRCESLSNDDAQTDYVCEAENVRFRRKYDILLADHIALKREFLSSRDVFEKEKEDYCIRIRCLENQIEVTEAANRNLQSCMLSLQSKLEGVLQCASQIDDKQSQELDFLKMEKVELESKVLHLEETIQSNDERMDVTKEAAKTEEALSIEHVSTLERDIMLLTSKINALRENTDLRQNELKQLLISSEQRAKDAVGQIQLEISLKNDFYQKLQNSIEECKKLKDEKNVLRSENQLARISIENLQKQLIDLEKLQLKTKNTLESNGLLVDELEILKNKLSDSSDTIQKKCIQIEQSESQIQGLNFQIISLKEDIRFLNDDKSALIEQIVRLEESSLNEVLKLRTEVEQLTEAKLIMKKELDTLNENIECIEHEKSDLQNKVIVLEESNANNEQFLKSKLDLSENRTRQLESDLLESKGKIELLSTESDSLKQSLLKAEFEVNRVTDEGEQLRSQIRCLENQIAVSESKLFAYDELLEKKDRIESEKNSLKEKFRTMEEQYSIKENQLLSEIDSLRINIHDIQFHLGSEKDTAIAENVELHKQILHLSEENKFLIETKHADLENEISLKQKALQEKAAVQSQLNSVVKKTSELENEIIFLKDELLKSESNVKCEKEKTLWTGETFRKLLQEKCDDLSMAIDMCHSLEKTSEMEQISSRLEIDGLKQIEKELIREMEIMTVKAASEMEEKSIKIAELEKQSQSADKKAYLLEIELSSLKTKDIQMENKVTEITKNMADMIEQKTSEISLLQSQCKSNQKVINSLQQELEIEKVHCIEMKANMNLKTEEWEKEKLLLLEEHKNLEAKVKNIEDIAHDNIEKLRLEQEHCISEAESKIREKMNETITAIKKENIDLQNTIDMMKKKAEGWMNARKTEINATFEEKVKEACEQRIIEMENVNKRMLECKVEEIEKFKLEVEKLSKDVACLEEIQKRNQYLEKENGRLGSLCDEADEEIDALKTEAFELREKVITLEGERDGLSKLEIARKIGNVPFKVKKPVFECSCDEDQSHQVEASAGVSSANNLPSQNQAKEDFKKLTKSEAVSTAPHGSTEKVFIESRHGKLAAPEQSCRSQ